MWYRASKSGPCAFQAGAISPAPKLLVWVINFFQGKLYLKIIQMTLEEFLKGHLSLKKKPHRPTATMPFIFNKKDVRIRKIGESKIGYKVCCVSGHHPSLLAPHPSY